MKYFAIFIILIGFSGTFLFGNQANGLWIPQSQQELLEQSQLIFVGNITSIKVLEFEQSTTYFTEKDGIEQEVIENYSQSLDEYTVEVKEFVKNPMDLNEITVRQPTISMPGRVLPYGGFEIGDRVLFYIEEFDGTNTYSKESFLIPEQCDASTVVHEPRMIGSDYKMMQHNMEKQDNFTANSPITFVAQSDMGTLFGASLEYDVYISKQVGKIYKDIVFHEKITAGAKPCKWLSTAKWELTPDPGNYLMNGRVYKEGSNSPIGNKQFSVLPQHPLKQFLSGVSFNEILCKEDLELIQKYDGSPACVKPETKQKLIERGWATSEPIPLPKIDDKYYIEPKRKAQLEAVELDLRNKILQLHQKNSLGSFAVNLDHITKEIVVIVENEQFNSEIEEMISQYPDDIPIVFSNGKIEITDFSEPDTLHSSQDYAFSKLNMTNACTDEPSICYGTFENNTAIRIQCDFPIHSCGVKDFDNYTEVENEK